MTTEAIPPSPPNPRQPSGDNRLAPSPEKTLRNLFLTLFLRGRSSRGLQKNKAPKSVGQKLFWTLLVYAFVGMFALYFLNKPVFALSFYLHGMTFVFLGMFVASSAGEILFNKEEADILLHRPISAKSLLWAKVRVLVEVSLWITITLNLVGLFVGLTRGGPLFPIAHLVSTALAALFCTGCVVMLYQLCLRWFGRERLDGLMTMAQVFVAVGAVLVGQIPQFIGRSELAHLVDTMPWWVNLIPPAWFAGFDDALAGSRSLNSWLLAGVALFATATVLGLAFGVLARDYHVGLQALNESVSRSKGSHPQRRWLDSLAGAVPMRWILRNPVSRASYILSGAYLLRDRDVKLRVYPALAPVLIMPIVLVVRPANPGSGGDEFGIAFAGAYAGIIPFFALNMLHYSQQWRAADIFRSAPIPGPAAICHGARWAALTLITVPMIVAFVALVWFLHHDVNQLRLLLPGIIAVPLYALIPSVMAVVPLAQPPDEAKSTTRGLSILGFILAAVVLAAGATFAVFENLYWQFIAAETAVVAVAYLIFAKIAANRRWPSLE